MWRMDEFRQEGRRRPQRGVMDVVKENMQRVGEKDEDDPLWQPVKGAAERKRGSFVSQTVRVSVQKIV